MNRSTIIPVVMMRELARLLEVFPRPRYWAADDEAVARRWCEIFDGVAEEQLVAAVTVYRKGDHSFMPKAGQLRTLASKQPRYHGGSGGSREDLATWNRRGFRDASGDPAACPVCGRAWQAHPRVTIVHDHAKHRAANAPCEIACDEPKCVGTSSMPQRSEPVRLGPGELWYAPTDVAPLPTPRAPRALPPVGAEAEERAAIQEDA